MDRARGYIAHQVHVLVGCLVVWRGGLGGYEFWRAALLELDQHRRDQGDREGIQARCTRYLPTGDL